MGLDQGGVPRYPTGTRHEMIKTDTTDFIPFPHLRHRGLEGRPPSAGRGPSHAPGAARHQTQREIGWMEICNAADLLGHRVGFEHARFARGVSCEASIDMPEHPGVVRLNLVMPCDTGECHFRTTAKAREVVVPNRSDGDQQIGVHGLPIEMDRDARLEIPDRCQLLHRAAVVLPDGCSTGKITDEFAKLCPISLWVGAAGNQNGDGTRIDSGREQSAENHRENPGQVRPSGRIGNDDDDGSTIPRQLGERRTIDGVVHRPRDQSSEISSLDRGRWLEGPDTEPSEIHGHIVGPEGQLDDHRIKIPSWDKGDGNAGTFDQIP